MKSVRIRAGLGAAVAIAALAYRVGVWNIAALLRSLRIVLPILGAAGLIRLFVRTRAWSVALRADGICVPQIRLIGIRLASQAAAYLRVLGPAVSEPTKLVMLRNPSGIAAAAPATLAETGAFWFTAALLGLAGTCAGSFRIANSKALPAAAVVFGAVLALLATQRSLCSLLCAATGRGAPTWLKRAEEGELAIRSFRDRHRKAFSTVLVLNSLAQIITLIEVFAVLRAVGIRVSIAEVLVIEAAGRVVKILGAWIPGRIGADEGGAAASFALLGLAPAAGLMLAAARRVRDVLFCGTGIV